MTQGQNIDGVLLQWGDGSSIRATGSCTPDLNPSSAGSPRISGLPPSARSHRGDRGAPGAAGDGEGHGRRGVA